MSCIRLNKSQPKRTYMQLNLPTWSMYLIDNLANLFTRKIIKCFLGMGLLTLSFYAQAQSDPEYIQHWTALEEADFYYDVSYAVVKCSEDAAPMVLLNSFNEGGTYKSVGFTLSIKDEGGNEAEVIIEPFESKLGDMFIASCDSDEHSNLKFAVPSGIDAKTMTIEITYNIGS